eukprot:TRINITY_DN442_c0_g1::TRINITY_DN442_c0_g1_i1::g.2519::m.2519 TRINITY_DN442_c0_g1::TRINITY_DN442_c0_g1_i1::g.2519  ORF type:complete len:374 (+),score=90.90,DIOX_N/PF14226.1/2.1e-06,DIOX_N/PF14226.1/9.3e+02,2OG-FeII_Oxy/PF03171.15/5.7e+03,2OG-FeII_Oxy/PF03171.15/0.00099 TRINITY_DN442_c0_g1_i1:67-1188(+)
MTPVHALERYGGDNGVVILDYAWLSDGSDLSKHIEAAYGYDGLGILAIRNVPNFVEKRKTLLPLARKFALLPDEIKNKYAHEESKYSFGWSHGKEKLEGKPDIAKGSFYANPQYDTPVANEELISKFSPFVHPNIWPKQEVPEFEFAFKELGQLIVETGKQLVVHCDKFVQSVLEKEHKSLEDRFKLRTVIGESLVCKARLLHYFASEGPLDNVNPAESGSWCGWHNDHGSLTGLTSAMYLDANGNEVPAPDSTCGLYIKSRHGDLIKGSYPVDCLGFQIGETAQVHSGGILQATPHSVQMAQGEASVGVSRETFAVFMEPNWYVPMEPPKGTDFHNATKNPHLPKQVPNLETRWAPGDDFAAFTAKTLGMYY